MQRASLMTPSPSKIENSLGLLPSSIKVKAETVSVEAIKVANKNISLVERLIGIAVIELIIQRIEAIREKVIIVPIAPKALHESKTKRRESSALILTISKSNLEGSIAARSL